MAKAGRRAGGMVPKAAVFAGRARRALAVAAALALAGCIPNERLDQGKVREATEAHFGSALLPIEVGPVVVSGDHAIADWTQGGFGGRALFARQGQRWVLVLCSGDSIRRAENLKRAGVPDYNAGRLAARLSEAEAAMAPDRRARLRRFIGTAQEHQTYLKRLSRSAD